MPDVEGSDHCPINVELDCTCVPAKMCPPLCTKFMPEFSGKQQKLSTFFTKLSKKESDNPPDTYESLPESEQVILASEKIDVKRSESESKVKSENSSKRLERDNSMSQPLKKQKTEMKKSASGSKQASLTSFFNKGAESKKNSVKVEQNTSATKFETMETSSKYFSGESKSSALESKKETVTEVGKAASTGGVTEKTSETANAWKNLLGGLGPPPLCKGHNEPCVLRMVKKPGPNKGKQFYTCARGEGHKSNPEARCDFFKWVVKKKT